MPATIVCLHPFRAVGTTVREGQMVSLHRAAAAALVASKKARYATDEETRGQRYRTPSRRRIPGGRHRHQSGPGRPPAAREITPPPPQTLDVLDPADFSEEEVKAATINLDLATLTVDEAMNLINGAPLATLEGVRKLEAEGKGRKTLLARLDAAIEEAKAAAS